MTGTEPHAPRGTAGRGTNWDRGPCAGHAGAARRCTKRHRRPWAQPGPSAVDGPRRLRVDACASRHRRPRDHSWDRGPYAGRRSCATRSGPTRLRMPTLAPPAAGPARGPWASGGPEELRDSDRACGPFAVTSDRLLSILHPQVTVIGDSTYLLIPSSAGEESTLETFRITRLNWDPLVLKQTARKLVSLVTTQSCVSLVDKVSSEDSQRSSRNSLQALLRVKRLYPKHTV
jgi:hypothetical protein